MEKILTEIRHDREAGAPVIRLIRTIIVLNVTSTAVVGVARVKTAAASQIRQNLSLPHANCLTSFLAFGWP